MQKYFTLQVVRALAALAVVFNHIYVIGLDRAGVSYLHGTTLWGLIGVDVFFVLSGFIIWSIHRKEFGEASKLKGYVLKRLFRIWPLLAVVTTGKLLAHLLAPQLVGSVTMEEFIASYLMLPVSAEFGGKPIIAAGWTLSFEMLFYLAFGLGILFNYRFITRTFSVWASAIVLMEIFQVKDISYVTKFLFDPHVLQFFMGCLTASFVAKETRSGRSSFIGILILGVTLLILGCYGIQSLAEISKLNYSLIFGVGASCLIYALVKLESICELKMPRLLVYLGDASYSIYLIHAPFQVAMVILANKFLGLTNWINWQVCLTLIALASAGVGLLVYEFIEKRLNIYSRQVIKKLS